MTTEGSVGSMGLAEAMMGMLSMLEPIMEAAEGMRADMERRGWSPTLAEQAAFTFMMSSMRIMFNGLPCPHTG